MSVMKTKPVLICKRCGRAYTFFLKTSIEDVEGKILYQLMDGILKDGYCDQCFAQRNWYSQQGRLSDWEAGRHDT